MQRRVLFLLLLILQIKQICLQFGKACNDLLKMEFCGGF